MPPWWENEEGRRHVGEGGGALAWEEERKEGSPRLGEEKEREEAATSGEEDEEAKWLRRLNGMKP